MKRFPTIVIAALLGFASTSCATNSFVSVKSPYPVSQTVDRLEASTKKRGMKVFARIDHAAGAASIGKTLRPTELLIFGNPEGGTPLMQCSQTAGVELPLKALAWQDERGQVWLGYNDPRAFAKRHGITACPAVEPINIALARLVAETVAP